MGVTNLLAGLERKYGSLTGSLLAKREEVDRIRVAHEKLPDLEAEVVELEALVKSAESLLLHIKPDWQRDTVDPVRPFIHQIPVKLGECSRKALEVLRDADAPMTTREITDEVLRREGVSEINQTTRERTRSTVDQALRKRRWSTVDHDGGWPARWFVLEKIEGQLQGQLDK